MQLQVPGAPGINLGHLTAPVAARLAPLIDAGQLILSVLTPPAAILVSDKPSTSLRLELTLDDKLCGGGQSMEGIDQRVQRGPVVDATCALGSKTSLSGSACHRAITEASREPAKQRCGVGAPAEDVPAVELAVQAQAAAPKARSEAVVAQSLEAAAAAAGAAISAAVSALVSELEQPEAGTVLSKEVATMVEHVR